MKNILNKIVFWGSCGVCLVGLRSGDMIANDPPPFPMTPPPLGFWKFLKRFFFWFHTGFFQHPFKMKKIRYTEFYALYLAQENTDGTWGTRVFFTEPLYSYLVQILAFIWRKCQNFSKISTTKMIIIIFSRFEVLFSSKKSEDVFFFFFCFSEFSKQISKNFRPWAQWPPPSFLEKILEGGGGVIGDHIPWSQFHDTAQFSIKCQ